jgi:hypothetical protein
VPPSPRNLGDVHTVSVLLEKKDRIAILRINRPDTLKALRLDDLIRMNAGCAGTARLAGPACRSVRDSRLNVDRRGLLSVALPVELE